MFGRKRRRFSAQAKRYRRYLREFVNTNYRPRYRPAATRAAHYWRKHEGLGYGSW